MSERILNPNRLQGDPIYDNFEAAWHALTDEQRQRFVDEEWTELFHMCQTAMENEECGEPCGTVEARR